MWLQHDFATLVSFAFIRKCFSGASMFTLHHLLSERYLIVMHSVKIKVLTLSSEQVIHFSSNISAGDTLQLTMVVSVVIWWGDFWTMAPSHLCLAVSVIAESSQVLLLQSNADLPVMNCEVSSKLLTFPNVHWVNKWADTWIRLNCDHYLGKDLIMHSFYLYHLNLYLITSLTLVDVFNYEY